MSLNRYEAIEKAAELKRRGYHRHLYFCRCGRWHFTSGRCGKEMALVIYEALDDLVRLDEIWRRVWGR